jgi:uncharacterized HAD superfamily protein
MRIAIDIDSTLHHYWDVFEQIVRERHGVELPYEEQVTWGITRLDPALVAECVAETHTEEYVLSSEPYPHAVETVAAWHERGHYIHITSHRSVDSHDVTARWLDRIGLPFDDLYCSYDKVTRCVELDIDLLIDDSPVNLDRASEHGIAGATIIHPWNRSLAGRPDIVVAPDWRSLARALEPKLGPPPGR